MSINQIQHGGYCIAKIVLLFHQSVMNPWKRLLFYLILNAIVSAVTTLTVLTIWDRNHQTAAVIQPVSQLAATVTQQAASLKIITPSPAVTAGSAGTVVATKPGTPAEVGTATPKAAANTGDIQIENVFGVGDLNTEVVLLKRTGNGELWLTGWRLEDENNHRYVLPELMLNKDGAIKVYTKPGTNSVIELHMGIKEAIWSSGELVSLMDQNGAVRATYRIP